MMKNIDDIDNEKTFLKTFKKKILHNRKIIPAVVYLHSLAFLYILTGYKPYNKYKMSSNASNTGG
jgi:hypothetical protein